MVRSAPPSATNPAGTAIKGDPTNSDIEIDLERLRAARRASRLTQQDVAERMGVARTTIVAIEKGDRAPRPGEIMSFARIYNLQVNELLRPSPVPADFVTQFRLSPGDEGLRTELEDAVSSLQRLADDYVELERVAAAPLPQRYPAERNIEGTQPQRAGEMLANSERNRLGIGDGPVFQLRQMLESDVGIRIFSLPLPARVAGLFVYSAAYGVCVAINSGHPFERQRWSLSHEYAHFIAQRQSTEITMLNPNQRVPAAERFADAFAENFLMPAAGMQRRFEEVRQVRKNGVTPADLLHLADLYQVSLEALVRRLENLNLVRAHTWDRLVNQGFRVHEARDMLERAAMPADTETLPLRFRYLAVEAFLRGEISEGQFARFLRSDRTTARGLAMQLSHRISLDEDGVIADVEFDETALVKAVNG